MKLWEWIKDIIWPREPLQMSQFGSLAKVREISSCDHEWEPFRAIIFDTIRINAICKKCGTFNHKLPSKKPASKGR